MKVNFNQGTRKYKAKAAAAKYNIQLTSLALPVTTLMKTIGLNGRYLEAGPALMIWALHPLNSFVTGWR